MTRPMKKKNTPARPPPDKPATPERAASQLYRCPACGEQVDGSSRDAVALHHQHVLHPNWFLSVRRARGGVR